MTIEKKPARGKHLTPKQWAEIERLWELGEVTLEMLEKRFKKDSSTFKRHFARHGIKRGSKKDEHKAKVAEEVQKAVVDDVTIVAARIKETKEEHYKMAAGLAKLTWAEILKAKQDGLPVSTALNNLKALDAAMSVLTKARAERYAVLGLDRDDAIDEDGLPELVIQELTPEQVKELRSRDDVGLDDMGVEVTDTSDEESDEEVVEEG